MSLFVPRLCRTCARVLDSRQSGTLSNRRLITNHARRLPQTSRARKRPPLSKDTAHASIADQLAAAFSDSGPAQRTPSRQRQKQEAAPRPQSLKDQLKSALLSDIEQETASAQSAQSAQLGETGKPPKPSRKPKKLNIKGINRAQQASGLVPVSRDVARALADIGTTANKVYRTPTKTDGIGMLNQRVATTSTRAPPRFQSPVETPPHELARQDLYLAPTGSFTYDVDVLPFDWRNQKNYVDDAEPKRQPWEPVEEVPPPGVILPRWWPKTHEGWDQLDSAQLHAAEEAYARFNPKQPTDSQQFHKVKKAVVRAFDADERAVRQQAEQYAMHVAASQAAARPRTRPSAASGGVPDPSQQYLAQADVPSQRLDAAQPLLIVVDLNGTMLHRADPKRNPRKFVQRPFAPVFLNYCLKTFWVVVWSSARADNVASMCDALATPQAMKRDVVAVWARDRFGLDAADYDSHVQCYKRLTRLWDDPAVAQSHPDYANGGRWSQANTVLLDDSPEKARAEPYNAIIVPEFSNDNGPYDDILPVVHDYINTLCFQSNVSNYMRENPFHAAPTNDSGPANAPTSMAFYNTKLAEKERKKARKDYKYAVSSLNLKNTVARSKAKLRAGTSEQAG